MPFPGYALGRAPTLRPCTPKHSLQALASPIPRWKQVERATKGWLETALSQGSRDHTMWDFFFGGVVTAWIPVFMTEPRPTMLLICASPWAKTG